MTESTGRHLEHAPLAASAAESWVNCHGFISLIQSLPPQEDTEHTKKGNEVHADCEKCLKAWLEFKINGEDSGSITCNSPENAKIAADYVTHIWKDILEESITGKAYGIEEKLILDESLLQWGHSDFWAIWKDDRGKRAGAVVDYKNGRVFVDVKKAQLPFYAVALRNEMRRQGKDLDYVITAIFGPNFTSGEHWQVNTLTSKQLDKWADRFEKAAHEILVKKSTKTKVGDWCKYCHAQGICPAYSKTLTRKTDIQLVEVGEKFIIPDAETIPAIQREKIALHADALIKFVKEVKKSVVRELASGLEYSESKLVEGTARRAWIKNKEDIQSIFSANSIPRSILFEEKLRAWSKVEADLKTSLGKEDAKNLMESVIEKGRAPIKLVPIDDPRPAVKNVLDMLDDSEEE